MKLTAPAEHDWMARGRQNPGPNRTTAADQSFDEGDEVDTPAGPGVVVEIRTESFEGPGGDDVDASSDNPAYVVAVEDGARVYRQQDLSAGEIDVDVPSPEADLEAALKATDTSITADVDTFEYPPSWRKSDQPSRLIMLKAWANLGGRFTSCRREMAGDVASPARFCAAMKDRVLQWEGWRQGG